MMRFSKYNIYTYMNFIFIMKKVKKYILHDASIGAENGSSAWSLALQTCLTKFGRHRKKSVCLFVCLISS